MERDPRVHRRRSARRGKEEDVEEGILAIPPSPPISGLKPAHKLHKATGGTNSSLMKSCSARPHRLRRGRRGACRRGLREAFEFARRGSKADNPFGPPAQEAEEATTLELPEGFENELTGVRKGERQDRDSFSKR